MTYGPDPRRQIGCQSGRDSVPKIRTGSLHAVQLCWCADHQTGCGSGKSLDPKKMPKKCIRYAIEDGARRCSYDKKGDIDEVDYVMYIWKRDPSGKITYVECPGSDCSKVK